MQVLRAPSTIPRCPTDPPAHDEIRRPQRDFHLSLFDQRDNLRDAESVRKQDLRRTSNVFFRRIASLQQKGKGSGKMYQRKGKKMVDVTP